MYGSYCDDVAAPFVKVNFPERVAAAARVP
jgi:hypothetical protein